MSKKKVVIYTDGNKQIGMGHVMRMLSLADGFRSVDKNDTDVVFFLRSSNALDTVLERGYGAVTLEVPENAEQEISTERTILRELLEDLEEKEILFLTDSYEVDAAFISDLREKIEQSPVLSAKKVTIASMDDTMDVIFSSDVVINYNLYAKDWDYKRHYEAYPKTRFLLGSAYAPLRKQFVPNEGGKGSPSGQKNILFMSGGADPLHMTIAFLKRWIQEEASFQKACHLTLLCGKFNGDMEEIRSLAAAHDVSVLQDVSEMADVLKKQDLVISAAGSSMYELCALGIPAITYITADNQRFAAAAFAEKTGMLHAGNFAAEPDATMEHLLSGIRDYLTDEQDDTKSKYRQLAERMHALCDGQGAVRLAGELIRIMEEG
ncbi:MAG: UDP-2,4-diacetamido-2,4,6-trideoxy-beta-L-altropyranose hydrolase [Lachnospiraceae bacterium]|nr:UDP-2,4-diacetamido-2,4,6-trideoxy-beta-L-altropyranose hydrolase [Lachnospiraceae bacterium]